MKRTNYYPTLGQLQYRAKKHGLCNCRPRTDDARTS